MITLEAMPPLMFSGLVLAMLIGFPVAFTLAAVGISFGFLAISQGFFDLNFLQAIPGRVFGSVLSNELLLDPVLHLHGRDPRTLRTGRGHAGFDGPVVRPDPRRSRLLRHHSRLHPRRP